MARRKNDICLYADELGKGLIGELDYSLEAKNALEFKVFVMLINLLFYFKQSHASCLTPSVDTEICIMKYGVYGFPDSYSEYTLQRWG